MRTIINRLAGVLACLLWVVAPAWASPHPEVREGAGLEHEIFVPPGTSDHDTIVDCRAMQCGFFVERFASREVATAAGAKPPSTSYAPSMFPELPLAPRGAGAASGLQSPNEGSLGGSLASTAVEPALFTIIEAGSADSPFCIEAGHLLSIRPSCKTPRPKPCDLFSTDGQNPPCAPGIPEPGSLLLFGTGLLGLVVVRTRKTR